jgi:NADPH2 dehydrogenase
MSKSTSNLFQPIRIGAAEVQHRIVHAPTTRLKADEDHVQLPFVAEYYEQRSRTPGTLLIAEATLIALKAGGYKHVPGIWSEDQIASWKKVSISCFHLQAVHITASF